MSDQSKQTPSSNEDSSLRISLGGLLTKSLSNVFTIATTSEPTDGDRTITDVDTTQDTSSETPPNSSTPEPNPTTSTGEKSAAISSDDVQN
ncbi:hypothetical protein SARC_01325 [Sphaeroforma arctica JP610]|uniref:Uncharacterized protein n=1 Tax=Sphaeroforma arctica JP610 TaxID=667725 RepID=A0A0L0GC14_9EUKA|nr:hypothetical protein SARC_01325 [Sphaeroforma arctica JP610]KNC86552.1 hypothetical protein SARC_01325 [Sphaeroforma arctica JP610]|eukprot:XP_014160454.1 hypothetical protein SARC_01325 [Sphaeroforma arctica JP610]